jgi:hypothetical protein
VGLSVGLGTWSRAETAAAIRRDFSLQGLEESLAMELALVARRVRGGVPRRGNGTGDGAGTPLVAGDAAAGPMILHELVFSFAWGTGTIPCFIYLFIYLFIYISYHTLQRCDEIMKLIDRWGLHSVTGSSTNSFYAEHCKTSIACSHHFWQSIEYQPSRDGTKFRI